MSEDHIFDALPDGLVATARRQRQDRSPTTSAGPSGISATVRAAQPASRESAPPLGGKGKPTGPAFDRADLERLASGPISEVFGPRFAALDGRRRVTRLPQAPLLLIDRVLGIDADPCSLGGGSIWTETAVDRHSWYLDECGRMPAGMMIEALQGDLLLSSWLGADLGLQGDRICRVLGGDLIFHGSPPELGQTLTIRNDVHGFAEYGGIRLCSFTNQGSVDGRPVLTLRNGQAGYFTDTELATTPGLAWNPAASAPATTLTLDPPIIATAERGFDEAAVRAFAEGRPDECFGRQWYTTRAHVRSPRIGHGRMLMLHTVSEFVPRGGPWRRGYLRAELPISPRAWFFASHFKNDPCMPGSLVFEGCLQAMAFYLTAMGFTSDRDGWRFEPVTEQNYGIRWRGQVTPRNRELTYELFVSELHAGPEPTVYADVVCTVDGVKAVHISRLGLRLVPDWPLTYWGMLGPPRFLSADDGMPSDVGADTRARVPLRELGGSLGHLDPRPVANSDGHAFGYRAMLATAWGHYTEAFGGLYKSLDDHRAVSRLPGPPYLMMSRATCIEGSLGRPEIGNAVTAEYDVSEQHWYWDRNREAAMPIAVLLEILLQPCGWLTCHAGFPLSSAQVLRFRNLDGTGIVTGDVLPGAAVMTTRATLRSMARNQDIIILGFDVSCRHGDREVFTGAMTFGYFPARALEQAGGVPTTEQERHCLHQPCDLDVDLSTRPRRFFAEPPGLPGPMLLMLDRITGFWPDGGIAGLGRLRAVKDVDAGDWYFKAHFFQDPVCPGSLGLQAMYQLLAYYMIDRGMHEGVPGARFAVAHPANTLSWTYRGQVTPATTRFTIDLHLTEVSQDTVGGHAVADAWLWADGVRIYEVRGLRLRIVSAPRETQR